jgi:hypothetical protein
MRAPDLAKAVGFRQANDSLPAASAARLDSSFCLSHLANSGGVPASAAKWNAFAVKAVQ